MNSDPLCPHCARRLVTMNTKAPWCSACEWNLNVPEPTEKSGFLARTDHRLAFSYDEALFKELSGQPPEAPRTVLINGFLILLTGLHCALMLTALGTGLWLLIRTFPSIGTVFAVALITIAWMLRPRFQPNLEDADPITRDQAPTLFALLDEVAMAVGVPVPPVIATMPDFNAAAASIGLRGRRTLLLGLSLWSILPPGQRVALLAHELGHFANNDPANAVLTQPALRNLLVLARVIAPGSPPIIHDLWSLIATIGYWISYPFCWTLSKSLTLAHIAVLAIACRDHQRAEYVADAIAVRVAGSAATTALTDTLSRSMSITRLIRTTEIAARHHGTTANTRHWRQTVENHLSTPTEPREVLRQRSIRNETTLFATHPPSGRRARVIATWPWHTPRVILSPQESDHIDQELIPRYKNTADLLVNSVH